MPPHILRLSISSLLNENNDTAIDEVSVLVCYAVYNLIEQ